MGGTSWVAAIGATSLGREPVAAAGRKTPAPGPPTRVEFIQLPFRRWDGPIGEWAEHFGKGAGQVYSLGGKPKRSCNEVEVAKRLRRVRDHAFWFSQYNPAAVPKLWGPWVRSLGGEAPKWLTALDSRIRARISSRRGGMPDVVAWNDCDPLRSALFVECKGPGESIGEAQEDWIWAARKCGVRVSQLAVSLRPF